MITTLQQVKRAREVSIEEKARRLLFRYWKQEEARLGQSIDPKSLLPIDVAGIARSVLGLQVLELWNVDVSTVTSGQAEPIGWVDRGSKRIAVARDLSPEVRRFTLAHEIGHLVTQPNVVFVRFRDDPRTDQNIRAERKPVHERQADFFAGFVTAPRKLLVDYFARMFGNPIDGADVTEDQAYTVLGENGIPFRDLEAISS